MVVVGCSKHLPQVGAGVEVISETWQKLAQVDSALMATPTNERWAFVAWCDVGHVSSTGNVGTGAAQMVVAFGDDLGPHAGTEARVSLNDPRYRDGTGTLNSWPAMWVRTYESTLIGRGSWNKNRRPAIWARLDRNGDSVAPTAAFTVAGVSILAFRLDASGIASTDWACDRFAPAQPQNNNGSSRLTLNWRTFHQSAWSSIFDGQDDWLVAAAVRYRPPTGTAGPPLFQTTYSSNGTVGAQQALTGRSLAFGWAARGAPLAGTTPHSYQAGSFTMMTGPAASSQLGLRGVDPNPTGQTAQVEEWEVFTIRASSVLGLYANWRKNPGTPPPAGSDLKPIMFDAGATTTPEQRELFEWGQQNAVNLEVVTSYLWLPQTALADPRQLAHRPNLATNTGSVDIGHGLWRLADHVNFAAPEGVPLVLGATAKNLGLDDVQLQVYALGNPVAAFGSQARQAADFCLAAWSWENDPQDLPAVPPGAPSPTYLALIREGLDVGSLPVLPIAPDVEMPHSVRREANRLVSDDGQSITWPSWLTVRRTFEWSWSGLDDADRAALLAVIGSQFRWQRPRDLSVAGWVPIGRPKSTDLGSHRWAVSGTFVELVWTGG